MRRAVQAGWSRRACRLLLAATAILWTATGARAQTQAAPQAAPEIKAIEVEGNRHVPTDQILTWLALRPGDRFDPARVSRAVRELSTKKRFKDVRAEGERVEGGVTLHVIVEELPYLQEIRIDGAKDLKEKEIRDAMRLASGSFLAPAALRSDRDKIVELYREKGYYQVAVDDSLTGAPGEPQILLLRVREGEKGSVKSIEFVGNTHASTKELRKAMETRVDGLVSGGELKDAVLREDFERVAGHYRSLGYLDAQVTGHEIVVGPNGRDLIIRITVNEGELYKAGEITWSGNKAFDDDAIRRLIQLRLGLPFDESKYEATTAALAEMYNDAGYIQFNAVPRRDVRDRVVNVHYDMTEGDVAHVHHIRVLGNTKTQDKVILREFLVAPGDTFDRSKLLRSIREVYALGFFEDAGIERVVPREDGSVDLELRVAERQTGQLGAGAGYSAVNAVTGFLEVAETNLFGTGQRLSMRWEFSRHQNEIDFSFTQPWLFDTPTTLGIELFNSSKRYAVNDFYRDNRTGGALTLGRRLDVLDYTRVLWRFRAEKVELTDFDPLYQGPLRDRFKDGPRKTLSTGLTLRRSSTDNPFFPSAGSDAEVSSDLFGTFLGGDENYLRSSASMAWYQRLGMTKLSLMLRTRWGLLQGLRKSDAPEYEFFRLGGNRYFGVRGYDDFEIVPVGNPQSLGGKAMSTFTAETVYPFSPKVHGLAFFDAGNTWNSFGEADFSFLRKGAGFGIRVEVPGLGTLGLDYGFGFDRVDPFGNDRDAWNLHFNFGSLF